MATSTWTVEASGCQKDSAPEPECPLCLDTGTWTGYVETPDGSHKTLWANGPCPRNCAAGQVERRRREQARIDELFGAAQINAKWRGATLADFTPPIRQSIQARLDAGRGAFLYGDFGVGKTRMLVAALYSRLQLGETGLYLTVPKLLLKIKATFGGSTDATEAELVGLATSVRWLGLDDLGAERPTDWARAELFQIVNERYDRDLPILGTSNLSFDQLDDSAVLGKRIVSRLREMCGRPVEMRGADRRESVE